MGRGPNWRIAENSAAERQARQATIRGPPAPNPLGRFFYTLATASRANDSGGGADSRVGRSSYSSRDSHKDWGSTALVDILQWVDHFEPWQT